MRDEVVLVNSKDEILGIAPKLEAHREGLLHRAFSVVIYNPNGEILLQQRAKNKYHSAGLWSNTCCSHPQPGEDIKHSAQLRLYEEMSITAELEYVDKFQYRAELENDMIEHEIDYVFRGYYDGIVKPNPTEAIRSDWVTPECLAGALKASPYLYTYWLPLVLKML